MEKNLMKDFLKKARGEFIAAHSKGPEGLKALKAWDSIEGISFVMSFMAVRAYRIGAKDLFGDLGAEAFVAVSAAVNAALDEIDAEMEAEAKAAGMSRMEYMEAKIAEAEAEAGRGAE